MYLLFFLAYHAPGPHGYSYYLTQHIPTPMLKYAPSFENHVGPNPDGSYSFSYSTGDQARQESADGTGTVRGSYWYINDAGKHDLSYTAGESTGFKPIAGSLATEVSGRSEDEILQS